MDILVVEDHALTRRALCRVVEQLGHRAHGVGCGKEAIAVVSTVMPDVCLLDMNLPDMTGLDVLSKLTQMPHLSTFRAIAITGDSEPSDIQRYYESGIDKVLIKPVSLNSLNRALSERLVPRHDQLER